MFASFGYAALHWNESLCSVNLHWAAYLTATPCPTLLHMLLCPGLPADARELVADVNILRRQQLKLELLVLDGTQDTLMDQKLGKVRRQLLC